MKKMQNKPQARRMLDSYRRVLMSMPEYPEIRRFIWRSQKTIYINTAARPGAKIDQLLE